MAIKLQNLESDLNLDVSKFVGGSKLALGAVSALAIGIGAAVAGVGLMVKATFKWADEVDGLGDVIGGTNKQVAALAFIARKSGVSIDKFTAANVILEKGLLKTNGTLDTTGKKLKEFGIDVKDANGVVKDQIVLTDEIAEKYAKLGTAQERVNFLTEIYGKQGAGLIDFFDTLASEGGIDTVAEKVERLGLAIDPSRYEMFNRNLEELKLIGLGLAVQFTEKVMPTIEKFLELISDPKNLEPSKILAWADTAIGVYIKGLGDSVNQWVAGGGPEQLSEDLVSWIENFGDADAVKSKTQIAVEHLMIAIGNALREVDWGAVQDALGDKFEEAFDANRPRGQNAVFDFFDALEVAGTDATRTTLQSWYNQIDNWLMTQLTTRFKTGGILAANQLTGGLMLGFPNLLAQIQNLIPQLDTKLRDIAKTFYNRAQGWANKAAEGFRESRGRILEEVTNLVGLINGILRKIMTTFNIQINFGGIGGATGEANLGGGGSSGGHQPGRASGGAVLAGQPYNVLELGNAEVFTPNQAGRIDPMKEMQSRETTLSFESILALKQAFKEAVLLAQ